MTDASSQTRVRDAFDPRRRSGDTDRYVRRNAPNGAQTHAIEDAECLGPCIKSMPCTKYNPRLLSMQVTFEPSGRGGDPKLPDCLSGSASQSRPSQVCASPARGAQCRRMGGAVKSPDGIRPGAAAVAAPADGQGRREAGDGALGDLVLTLHSLESPQPRRRPRLRARLPLA